MAEDIWHEDEDTYWGARCRSLVRRGRWLAAPTTEFLNGSRIRRT